MYVYTIPPEACVCLMKLIVFQEKNKFLKIIIIPQIQLRRHFWFENYILEYFTILKIIENEKQIKVNHKISKLYNVL